MPDDIDRGLIHALHLDGRAPFSRIGAVLGVSTQTVTRRYRRLRAEAALRVVGLPDPHRDGRARWLARLTVTPRTAQDLAYALARRADTSWVKLASGGTEIILIIDGPAGSDNTRSLLLHDIPRTAGVTAVSAHYLLHTYHGGRTTWGGPTRALDAEQVARLTPDVRPGTTHRPITDADAALLTALAVDGRTSQADLAAATGWSAATVARRLAELQSSGAIFFDVEQDPALHGITTSAFLWLSIAPAHLDAVATEMATHPELTFVAATTGPTNLAAQVLCSDTEALHHYLTRRLGTFEAIHALETAPVLRTVKTAAPLRRL